jgi:hypothetical protein
MSHISTKIANNFNWINFQDDVNSAPEEIRGKTIIPLINDNRFHLAISDFLGLRIGYWPLYLTHYPYMWILMLNVTKILTCI